MTNNSLTAILKLVNATSKSKDEAEKTAEQFIRMGNSATSAMNKLLNATSQREGQKC